MSNKKESWVFCYWDEQPFNNNIKTKKNETTSNTSRKETIDQAKKNSN
tara:strand:- start:26 stop:169 length:144 start_codon:yes stop_codon:yes gene_type:complete